MTAGLGKEAAESSGYKTVGVYAGALGWGYNTDLFKQKNYKEPKCWADLLDPSLKGEIQMANPNSSGTAYTALASLVQIMGEDKAFDYLKQLNANVSQYTKSGSAPVKRQPAEKPVSASYSCMMQWPRRSRAFRSSRLRPARGPATRSVPCRSSRVHAIWTMQKVV